MSFAWPGLLVLLALVPILLLGYRAAWRGRAARRVELGRMGLRVSAATDRLRHVPVILLALALTAGVVAVARPYAQVPDPRREGTVILAFDTSVSMTATDIAPTRLAAAQAAARTLVLQRPDTIKIGVVAFGGVPIIVQQPTTDTPAVLAAIDRLNAAGGTSVGGGLLTSLSAIAGKSITPGDSGEEDGTPSNVGYYGGTSVIMLTDGENTEKSPDPQAMADLSSVAGVKVFPIGLGSPDGTTIEVDGYTLSTRLDADLLRRIAQTTDGTYYNATDADSLATVYDTISRTWTARTVPYEITSWMALLAGLALAGAALISVVRTGRVV